MLQFPGGLALRVEVSHLLELQCSLQGDGNVPSPGNNEHMLSLHQFPGNLLDSLRFGENLAHFTGESS